MAAWPAFLRRHRTFGTIVAGVVATLFMALGALGALVQLAVALPGYRLDAVVAYWTSGPRTLTALLLKSDLVPQLRLLLHGEQDVWWLWNPGAMVAALVLAAIVTSAGIGLLRTTET